MYLFQYPELIKKYMTIILLIFSIFLYSCDASIFIEKPNGIWISEDKHLLIDLDNLSGKMLIDDEMKDVTIYFAHGWNRLDIIYSDEYEDILVFIGEYKLSKDNQKLELIKDDKVLYTLKPTD